MEEEHKHTQPAGENFDIPERSDGERSDTERSGGMSKFFAPDPEVPDRPQRRRFSRDYIIKILNETDKCQKHGEIGEILRREGLYSSQLSQWRKKRESGDLSKSRNKKKSELKIKNESLRKENEKLIREKMRLEKKLREAEFIIDFQKKISQILEIPLKSEPEL